MILSEILDNKRIKLRNAIRTVGVKATLKDLKRNNPAKDDTPGVVGDGGADEPQSDSSSSGAVL